ncbi:MAG: hypothetical protein MPK36_10360, partial [Gammaproteobacteria bacterium]|nr:hypothetical protein [Gammaproteobacteria bacterium]
TGTFAGTATVPADFAAITFPTFTIPADANSVTEEITITPVDDDPPVDDNNETIVLVAALNPYPDFGLTIPLREYYLNVDKTALGDFTEAGSTETFTVVLSSPPEKDTGNVVVDVTVDDLSEASVSPARLTFTPLNFNMPQLVTVTGANDNLDDGDKDIKVTVAINNALTGDGHYHDLSHELDGKTIDDDTAMLSVSASPAFLSEDTTAGGDRTETVTFTAELAGDVRLEGDMNVALAFKTGPGAGTAISGSDYTAFTPPAIPIASGQKTGTASVPITTTADTDDDSGETIVLTATLAPYTIPDLTLRINEFALQPSKTTVATAEDGSTDSFTLQLPTAPTGDVVITFASTDPGEADVSPKEVTFTTTNWSQPRTLVVSGVDDNFDDGDKPYTINFAVDMDKTMDANYHGRAASVMGETTDDDTATIAIRATPNVLSTGISSAQTVTLTAEVTSTARFEEAVSVTLNRPSGAPGGTATNTDASFSTPASISIPAAAASASVDMPVTVQSGATAGRTIILTGALSRAGLPDITVTPATITLLSFGYAIGTPVGQPTEGATPGAATIMVQLISMPSSTSGMNEVVIDVASSDTTEATVTPATLTFNDSNWDTAQPVTVTGVDDNFDDGDVRYEITFMSDDTATTDDNFDGISASVPLTTTDDDTVTIAVTAAPADLVENGTAQTVKLTATLTGGVLENPAALTLRDGGGSATSGADYAALTLPIMLNIPANTATGEVDVTITPQTDSARDNAETIIFAPALAPYTIAPVALTIREYELYASELSGAATEPGGEA